MKCREGLFYGSVGFKAKLMALLSARMVFSSCNMTTISFFYVRVRHKGKTPEERFILFQEKKKMCILSCIFEEFQMILKKINEFLMENILLNEFFAAKYKRRIGKKRNEY